MKAGLSLILGVLATAGCATHYTRSTAAVPLGPEAFTVADSAFRSLGYVPDAPPTHDSAAAARAVAASEWWTGSMQGQAVPPLFPKAESQSAWLLPRQQPDGAWRTVAVRDWRTATMDTSAVQPDCAPSQPAPLALWVRPRPDGGWDELGIGTERRSWFDYGCDDWTQLVIHGGSFAANGKERPPSKQVPADVDSVYTAVRRAR